MKKTLSFLLSLVIVVSLFPSAVLRLEASATTIIDSGYCGGEKDGKNLTWTLYSNGVLSIDGTGKMGIHYVDEAELEAEGPTNIWFAAYWDIIESVDIGDAVTSVGERAFSGLEKMKSITLPNSVTEIGAYAFACCYNLKAVSLPNSVTEIGAYAFEYCNKLATISFPNSFIKIGLNAFETTAWYNAQPDGVVYAGKVAYRYKGTMPKGYKLTLRSGTVGIADCAFYSADWNTELVSAFIPGSVKCIGACAFARCSELSSVTIGYGVKEIQEGAFFGCSFSSVEIPNSVTEIGDSAFENNIMLTSVSLSNNVTKIEYFTFNHCINLKAVSFPNSVTEIGAYAFQDCSELATISFPNNLTKIGQDAFDNTAWYNNLPTALPTQGM